MEDVLAAGDYMDAKKYPSLSSTRRTIASRDRELLLARVGKELEDIIAVDDASGDVELLLEDRLVTGPGD